MSAWLDLQNDYAGGLLEYIAKADEAALTRAYDVGRGILNEGYGVLDQVMLHSDVVRALLVDGAHDELHHTLGRAAEFLAESLSPFEMSLRGFQDANARLTALHETLEQKIEERTRELVVASKVKDDFLAMVSHELRTPLTSIGAVVALLAAGSLGSIPAEIAEPLRLAQRNCERLQRLVDDLIDLTRIGRGSFDLRLQSVELEPLLLHVVDMRRIASGGRAITFALADAAKGVRVAADPPRLQQVLNSLLSNAAKFSGAESVIEVGVERCAGGVRIAVTDHGIGISERRCEDIFKPFAQADLTSTRTPGGAGLGLSIARAIVTAHRGTLGFSSKEGVGTTFFFDLPVDVEAEAAA
jgi:signal transduction histidine kinase